jgi:hypothetical protein
MRNKELMAMRNKAIKRRYKELKQEFKNGRKIIQILTLEFWLNARTIKDILYLKNKDYRSQQTQIL